MRHGFDNRIVFYEDIHSISPIDAQKLIDAVNPKSQAHILDAMAGYGAVAHGILEREPSAEVYVLDESEVQIQRARENLPTLSDDKFVLKQLPESGFPSRFFDVVVLKMGLHEVSLEQQCKVVIEIKRILNSTGRFVVWDIMLDDETQSLFQNIIQKKDKLAGFDMLVGERYFFTEAEFLETMEKGGFKNVKEFHRINYRFSSKKRLHAEFGGDVAKLGILNGYIREIFPEALKHKMAYEDTRDDVQFNITKKIFIAQNG